MPGALDGFRIIDVTQMVSGPMATMMLADQGADVIKIEPPGTGDLTRALAGRRRGMSPPFAVINRNKRSVVIDLKSERGRTDSEALIASAQAVLHNFPPERALAFGLDRERVRSVNPRAVWCAVSALGSDGPDAQLNAFDLIAQALSGLLLADLRGGDTVPRRAGGIAMADFTAGLLAAIAVLGGLFAAEHERGSAPGLGGQAGGLGDPAAGPGPAAHDAEGSAHDTEGSGHDAEGSAPGIEVSLLGAALAVQAQRFVSVEPLDAAARARRLAQPRPRTAADLAARAAQTADLEALEPYYRAYRAADGFFALACLNERQRRSVLGVLGVLACEDPFVANPQAAPRDERERQRRLAHVRRVEDAFAQRGVEECVAALRVARVPAAPVRALDELFDDPQATRNGLVTSVSVDGVGEVRQLGSLFKVNGTVAHGSRPAPKLGEHTDEILTECRAGACTDQRAAVSA